MIIPKAALKSPTQILQFHSQTTTQIRFQLDRTTLPWFFIIHREATELPAKAEYAAARALVKLEINLPGSCAIIQWTVLMGSEGFRPYGWITSTSFTCKLCRTSALQYVKNECALKYL